MKPKKITLTDEEISQAGLKVKLPTGDFSASFISWLDKKVGFMTRLLEYNYNPQQHTHYFLVAKYD